MKQKYKILDYRTYGPIITLLLGRICLDDWSGIDWDKDFEDALEVDSEYVIKKVQLVVNPEKLTVVTLEDLDAIGQVQFRKNDLKKNGHPIFSIVKNSFEPESLFWSEDSRKYYMGQEIEIDDGKKFIAIGY